MKKSILTIMFLAVLICGFVAFPNAAGAEPASEEGGKDYVFDLTKGYYKITDDNYPDPEYEVFLSYSFLGDWLDVPSDPKREDEYSAFNHVSLDLDRDGTFDVVFQAANERVYSGPGSIVVVPLHGGSIKDRITLQGTGNAPFKSVTFILNNGNVKAEYPIKIQNGKAVSYTYDPETDSYERKEYTSAAPGTPLSIEPNNSLLMKGKYLKEWSSKDYSFPKREDNVQIDSFVMPAHAVTVTPVMANQTPRTITLKCENTEESRYDNWYILGQWEELDCFFGSLGWTWDTVGYGPVDLNGDGIDDIYFSPWKSTSAICALPIHSVTKDIVLNKPNDGPYWPITIHFSEPALTLNLGDGIAVGEFYGGGNYMTLLRQNLQPFEVQDKPGYYDIDKDGQPDVRFMKRKDPTVQSDSDEYYLIVLETYSLGASYTLPAAEGGFPKPITLKLTEKPKYYSVTLDVGEGGTVTLYEQEGNSSEFNILYPRVNPGEFEPTPGAAGRLYLQHHDYMYSFIPSESNRFLRGTALYAMVQAAPGYQLKSIEYTTGGETSTCLKRVITMLDDVTVTAVFEKIPEVTPTPTYTPTPTPSPTPKATEAVVTTTEPTKPVSEAPKGNAKDDDEEEGFPLWGWLIIIPLCVASAFAAVLAFRKKKPAEPISEQKETPEEPNAVEAQNSESADVQNAEAQKESTEAQNAENSDAQDKEE